MSHLMIRGQLMTFYIIYTSSMKEPDTFLDSSLISPHNLLVRRATTLSSNSFVKLNVERVHLLSMREVVFCQAFGLKTWFIVGMGPWILLAICESDSLVVIRLFETCAMFSPLFDILEDVISIAIYP